MVHSPTNKARLAMEDQLILDLCDHGELSGHCSVGIAHPSFAKPESANEMLFWFPCGVPAGSSVSVASSRMGQKLDEESEWFDALRTLAVQLSKTSKFLLTARETTTDPFVRRLSELFQIPIMELQPFPENPSPKWFEDQARAAEKLVEQGDGNFNAYFKPLQRAEMTQTKTDIDELLIGLAISVVLLSVRKGGNIHKAAQRRLARESQTGTRLLINRKLSSKPVESDLLQRGATAWWLYGQDCTHSQAASWTPTSVNNFRKPSAIILTLDELESENYLAHWTRRRVGRWPDQTNPEFLDDLIFLAKRRQHGEVSALCRILASGRILGSHDLTRDRRDVVCFSNLPLDEILNQRVFRPHLSRWDFEPYGIAIEREFLLRLGARPVVYGDESDWERLSEFDQAFFQVKNSKSAEIDWSREREWRIVGDLKLDDIPVDQAVVFVKTESDALIVAALSRWPVVILEHDH